MASIVSVALIPSSALKRRLETAVSRYHDLAHFCTGVFGLSSPSFLVRSRKQAHASQKGGGDHHDEKDAAIIEKESDFGNSVCEDIFIALLISVE